MALEEIEKNKEKINKAALSVIEKGAPVGGDEQTFDEQDQEAMKKMNINPDNYYKNEDGHYQLKETVNEKEEIKTDDGKFKIDLGEALSTKLDNVTGSLASFSDTVGSTFEEIATEVPKKIDEIYSDKDKKRNFLRGLYIINASSGITPISQAKSPLGKISEGLIKAEKQFTAEDIAKIKALKSDRRYKGAKETALEKLYTTYADNYEKAKKDYQSIDTRFNEVYKLAKSGKKTPTGILESSFSGLEKVLDEIGLLDEANALIGRNQDKSEFSDEDLIKFKEIFTAATKRQIVGQVKELYPVSNKDIEILLQTVGDISTSPSALRALVAAEKAAKEINENAFGKSFDIAFTGTGNINFRAESQEAAAKELAAQYKNDVKPETLVELYGSSENPTAFQIVNAYYHQQLEPVFKDETMGTDKYFEIFKAKKEEDTSDILTIISERQKKNK